MNFWQTKVNVKKGLFVLLPAEIWTERGISRSYKRLFKDCLSLIFALVALVYRKGFKFYKVFDFRFAYAQCSSDDEIIFSTIGIWKGKYPNNVFFCKCIGLK
jgi:hypothetical protein